MSKNLFSSMFGKNVEVNSKEDKIIIGMRLIQDYCNSNKCLDCEFNQAKGSELEEDYKGPSCYFTNNKPYLYDPMDIFSNK